MSEDTPSLTLQSQELWQWTQAALAVSQAVRGWRERHRARLGADGRLALADANHADRLYAARQHPPIRLMTDDELSEWQGRVPAELLEVQGDKPFAVWTAWMVDQHGQPTGEWGLEARTWDRGAPTSSVFIVLRDAEDALAMRQNLHEHGSPAHLAYLHGLATSTPQYAQPPTAGIPDGHDAASAAPTATRVPMALTEDDWEAALRRNVAQGLADQIIVRDPQQELHTAWRELYALANHEVFWSGVDPDALAEAVRDRPRWRTDVYNPPGVAHWAIVKERGRLAAAAAARRHSDAGQKHPVDLTDLGTGSGPAAAGRLHLRDVHTDGAALAWAKGLDRADPAHRVEAKQGLGFWGSEIDAILIEKFPSVAGAAHRAADKRRTKAAASTAPGAATTAAVLLDGAPEVRGDGVVGGVADGVVGGDGAHALTALPASRVAVDGTESDQDIAGLAEFIRGLDPSKAIDRRSAYTMVGRVPPEIDVLIAERFADDPAIPAKVEQAEAQRAAARAEAEGEAAGWRNRAAGSDAAAAGRAAPDDPRTAPREDIDGETAGHGTQGTAAHQRSVATTVVGAALPGEQEPVVRRTVARKPEVTTVRRS